MSSNLFWDLNYSIWIYLISFFLPILSFLVSFFPNILFLSLSAFLIYTFFDKKDDATDAFVFFAPLFGGILMLILAFNTERNNFFKKSFILDVSLDIGSTYFSISILVFLILGFVSGGAYLLFRTKNMELRAFCLLITIGLFSVLPFVTLENPIDKLYTSVTSTRCAIYYYTNSPYSSEKAHSLLTCGPPDSQGYPKSFINPKYYRFIAKTDSFSISQIGIIYVDQGCQWFQSLSKNIKGTIYGVLGIVGILLAYVIFCWLIRIPGMIADKIAVIEIFSGKNASKHTYKIKIDKKNEKIKQQIEEMKKKAERKESKIAARMRRGYFKAVKKQMKHYGKLDIDLALQMIEFSKIELENKKKVKQISSNRKSTIKMMAEEIKLYRELDHMVQTSDLPEKARNELHDKTFDLIKDFKDTNLQ
jgi:hypothetical protein